jgi:ferric enterobactin receptor
MFLGLQVNTLFAQNHSTVTGRIIDEQRNQLSSVNIKLVETNQYTISNKDGRFSIELNRDLEQTVTLEFSSIGFQKLTRTITVSQNKIDLGDVTLKTLDLSLKEITINAKRDYSGSSNSSLIINREMIEQIPALSISDLLNQIPNRKIAPPSLQNVQNLTLRSTFEPTTTGRDPFTLNNSFGVSIILDGLAISNNANMQSYNPGIGGLNGSGVSSDSGYGLSGTRTRGYSGDFAFGGTDLRQIPVDNIESIEVIAGVPSAKYGDLTDGAVIIERQAGKSPAYLRMQLRDNATSYSFSKGFKLSDKLGALNIGTNYVNSFADNRDKLKAYRRITTNAMWTNSFGVRKQIKNTFSFDYGQNLDGIKQDPDDPTKTKTRFDSWNFSVGNRTSYRLNGVFLKNVGLNMRYNEGHQQTYKEQLVNTAYIMYSDATTTGITEGNYDTGIYNSISQIDGRPINFSSTLDFNAELKTGRLTHFISFGSSFNYSFNKGLGQMSDPSKPRGTIRVAANSSSARNSERYYDFSLAIAEKDLGAYVEDMFKVKVFDRELNVRAGVRLDVQNGFSSFAPRTNINYQVNDNLRFGLAYGLSVKAPGLAHRYPGPTFIEIPLLNSYNGDARESTYLLYVERYDPTNKNLRPSQAQTMELTSQLKLNEFNLSFSVFNKISTNGINTVKNTKIIDLPKYDVIPVPGQKPIVTQTGTKLYMIDYYYFKNLLKSTSQGFEIIFNTPEIKQISTSFNVSGGLFRTSYHSTALTSSSASTNVTNTDPKYAKIGIYEPDNRVSYLSNGRITTTTHIPKISLIAQFTAEFSLLEKTVRSPTAGIPLAYYTNDLSYVEVNNFDKNDPLNGHLYKPTSELNSNNVPKIISNYHFSLAKEIKKRFKFSFNVYNVFNYQPTYTTSTGTLVYPNPLPTFGAELSLKL